MLTNFSKSENSAQPKAIGLSISIFCICMGILLGFLPSCNSFADKMNRELAEANKSCPMPIPGGVVSKFSYDEKNNLLVIDATITDQYIFDVANTSKKENLEAIKLNLMSPYMRPILTQCESYRIGLKYVYTNATTGKKIDFTIPYDDIKELSKTELSEEDINRNWLEMDIKAENRMLPQRMEDDMIMKEFKIEGDSVVMIIEIEGSDKSMFKNLKDNLKDNSWQVKQGMLSGFEDDESAQFLKVLTSLNMSLVYRFTAADGNETVDLAISPEELKQAIDMLETRGILQKKYKLGNR